jgi:hypothetical protein
MRRKVIAPLLGLSLFATASAPAHDLVPASWCTGGTRQLLLEVTFSEQQLSTYRSTQPLVDLATGLPCPNHSKCGIVDDEWHWATQLMQEGLPAVAGRRTTSDTSVDSAAGQVIGVILTQTYRDPYHHKLYRFEHGLHVRYLECRFTENIAG